MGLFDKITRKVSDITETAKKETTRLANTATSISKDISEKAQAGLNEFSVNVGTSAKELSAWAETMPQKLKKMSEDFDTESMWDKLAKCATKAGQDLIVMVLTIYYALESQIKSIQKKETKENDN